VVVADAALADEPDECAENTAAATVAATMSATGAYFAI
jgi:hypothetical protein